MNKTIKHFLAAFFVCLLQNSIVTAAGIPLGMVYVSSGYSMMGSEYGDLLASDNTKPYHLIYVDPFYMDVQEVTNADYAVCVAAGKCAEPESTASKTRAN